MSSTEQTWRGRLNEPIELYDRGERVRSLELLVDLGSEYPDIAPIQGLLGRGYFMLGEYGKALGYFRRATLLNPDSELASLGLYQCLAEAGRANEALEEMLRFTALHDSDEYSCIAQDAGIELPEVDRRP